MRLWTHGVEGVGVAAEHAERVARVALAAGFTADGANLRLERCRPGRGWPRAGNGAGERGIRVEGAGDVGRRRTRGRGGAGGVEAGHVPDGGRCGRGRGVGGGRNRPI